MWRKGTCLKCSINELRQSILSHEGAMDFFFLLLQVLTQHKLICIEVYLHSGLTHSNVTFFLPASLPVWSSPVGHSLCPYRLCGNGRPAVRHTPRPARVLNSRLLRRQCWQSGICYNVLIGHFTSNTQAYSETNAGGLWEEKWRCIYSTEHSCAENASPNMWLMDRYLHLPTNRPASMAYKRKGTHDNR